MTRKTKKDLVEFAGQFKPEVWNTLCSKLDFVNFVKDGDFESAKECAKKYME